MIHYSINDNTVLCVDADVKGLCGMYQRIIMIPRPDYASRVCKYNHTLYMYMYCRIRTSKLKSFSRNQLKFIRTSTCIRKMYKNWS